MNARRRKNAAVIHEVLGESGRIVLAQRDGPSVRIAACGDLDFHGHVSEFARLHGTDEIFREITPSLGRADFRFANLETVLVREPRLPDVPWALLVASPEFAGALRRAGFDLLTFANNHVMDQGAEGLCETLEHLRSAGIRCVGAGADESAARRDVILKVDDISIRFLAYAYGMGQIAESARPGCAEAVTDKILADVRRVASEGVLQVVSLHMDAEFQETPAPSRIKMCREIADAGVHLVVCHHPHVLQGVERWNDSVIAYSIGNYVTPISDYMKAHSGECHRSVQLELLVDGNGIREVEVVPVLIDDRGAPSPASGMEAEKIRRMVARRSRLLLDECAVEACYRRMVRDWGRTMLGLLVGAVRSRNLALTRRLVMDVVRTPTKRAWLFDLVLSLARPQPAYDSERCNDGQGAQAKDAAEDPPPPDAR